MGLDALAQLLGGILWMREGTARHRQVRSRHARDADVGDQRQDRVVGRAGDQLRLAALLDFAVSRQDLAHQLELRAEDRLLVSLGIVAALAHQLADDGIALDHLRTDPGEVEPHLQVAQLGIAEEPGEVKGTARPRLLPLSNQLDVARGLPDATDLARLGHPAGNEGALVGAQLGNRTARQLEVDVGEPRVGVVLHLGDQRRHQVEGCFYGRVVRQERRHLVVILGATHADPGKEEAAGEVVLVVRLVHVPDERHMQGSRHDGRV